MPEDEENERVEKRRLSAASWNILGLNLVLIGVLVLFRYGMPYRVRRGGATYFRTEEDDLEGIKAEKLYDRLGWLGLASAVVGTLCQIP